jgi:hypothetical protein
MAGADAFQIKDQDGVKLVYGLLPLATDTEVMTLIGQIIGEDARVDFSGIAQVYNARMAIGLPEDLDALRQTLGLATEQQLPTTQD